MSIRISALTVYLTASRFSSSESSDWINSLASSLMIERE
jgi:hypothetical protein